MRIALVIASMGTGGAERVMSLLANHWAERGDEVTLITLESRESDAYPLAAGVRRVALGLVGDSNRLLRALGNNWRRVAALRAAIRSSGANVVLSFEDRTNVLAVLATMGLGARLVLAERTDPTVHVIGKTWSLLRRLTYPFADALVVQTSRLRSWASGVMFGRARVHAIPNPLRTLRNGSEAPGRRDPLIATVGRLWLEKGHDVLLRAFAQATSDSPEWRLIIVGEGPERGSLIRLARELGIEDRLALPGWMAAPEEVLQHAALFVMPSRYEGFSNALLEAMGSGLPVISTTCGGSEEMITPGSSGMVVQIDDVDAMADAMRALMHDEDLRVRMGQRAQAAAGRYAPRAVMPMWDAVLNQACLSEPVTKSFS